MDKFQVAEVIAVLLFIALFEFRRINSIIRENKRKEKRKFFTMTEFVCLGICIWIFTYTLVMFTRLMVLWDNGGQ